MTSAQRAFTLVETLVASAILMIFFAAVGLILQSTISSIAHSRVQAVAVSLARERLELARNLPYASLGTVGGIPPGSLPQEETVVVNGQSFVVNTTVVYVDDAFDGGAPADTVPIDYKRVKVAVSWDGPFASKNPETLVTDIAGKKVESMVGGGTLALTVLNAQAAPLSGASVHIDATAVTPEVHLDTLTDDTGRVLLPGALICNQCYQVTASKTGYTSERTYGTGEVPNPLKAHLSVLEGEVTPETFIIDQAATLILKAVRSKAFSYQPFQGVQMLVTGTKAIGTDLDGDPVPKINTFYTTGGGGTVTASGLDADTYSITLPTGSSVDFAGSWPFNPIHAAPGATINYAMTVVAATPQTLLMMVQDQAHAPVASALVEMRNDFIGYLATESTGLTNMADYSQAFFPNLPATVSAYQVTVTSPGFAVATSAATVIGDTVETLQLTPN